MSHSLSSAAVVIGALRTNISETANRNLALQNIHLVYSYFMPVCSIVKTRPSAIGHQVVHGTEG